MSTKKSQVKIMNNAMSGGENPPFGIIDVIDSQAEIIDNQNRIINRLVVENQQLKNWIKINSNGEN